MGSIARNAPISAPMAFLSDIHGNLPALEAVLTELESRGVEKIYVAGDLLLGGDHPVEVFKRLQQVRAVCVQGLTDTALTRVSEDHLKASDEEQRERVEKFLETRRAIGEVALKYLERLPERVRIPMVDGSEIIMVHGSPGDPTSEMSADMSDEELRALVADDPADIVICGASHVAFTRDLDETRIVNVGSVGASPEGGYAHFAVVTPRVDGTVIEQTYVEVN